MELGSSALYVLVVKVGAFVELLTVRIRVSLTLCLFLGLISSYWVALPGLEMRFATSFIVSYFIVFS